MSPFPGIPLNKRKKGKPKEDDPEKDLLSRLCWQQAQKDWAALCNVSNPWGTTGASNSRGTAQLLLEAAHQLGLSHAQAFPQRTIPARNSWQLMPAQAEVILPQILPLPLITQFMPRPCQGCADKERIWNPVLLPQGFIFKHQIQQGKHRDHAVWRDNSVSNARCWSDINVHYSTCLQQMAFKGEKNIIWEAWNWSALHILLPKSAQLKIMS